MGIAMLITMLFCIGDLDAAINTDAPYLILFKNTGSNGIALFLLVMILVLVFMGNITALATTSRELWAFSRDKGFPCSRWISKVYFQSPALPSICHILTNILDEPQTPSPRQLRLSHLHHRRPPLPHQLRLLPRLQHNRLPNPPRPPLNLHDIHRLRAPPASPIQTLTSSPLVTRPLRHPDQRFRVRL